jgi:hypothetical protein
VSVSAADHPFTQRAPRFTGNAWSPDTLNPDGPVARRIPHCSAQYGQWVAVVAGIMLGDAEQETHHEPAAGSADFRPVFASSGPSPSGSVQRTCRRSRRRSQDRRQSGFTAACDPQGAAFDPSVLVMLPM